MKKLDFRSVDSLLKRAHPSLVILAMNVLESETYIKNFYQHYLKLTPTDFENQNIKFVNSPNLKWSKFLNTLSQNNKINHISCYELSTLIILPINNDLRPGQITSITTSLLEEINKIRSLSCYIKLSQVNKDFAKSIFNLSSKTTPVDADLLVISDSEDTNKAKDFSFANLKVFLKTYFDTIYTTTSAVATQITTALTGYLTSATASATYQVILTATNFGTFISGLSAKTTIVDADLTDITDSADTNKQKKVTWLNVWTNYIKAKADVVYAPIFTILSIAKGGTNSSTTLLNNRIMQSSGGAIVEASAITPTRALISDANGIPTQSVESSCR
jgi:hypothetical protein